MGTRSTITFYRAEEDVRVPYTTIYQQNDGYIDGVGKELCEWLSKQTMINGISDYGIPNICNGVGDLIAQYIARFKNGVGDLYVYPTGKMEDYCDYNYSVVFDDMHTYPCPVKDLVKIEVGNRGKPPFFKGTISELLEYKEEED